MPRRSVSAFLRLEPPILVGSKVVAKVREVSRVKATVRTMHRGSNGQVAQGSSALAIKVAAQAKVTQMLLVRLFQLQRPSKTSVRFRSRLRQHSLS
ncbi:hypothetical protein GCM10011383_07030 [Hymenobacter cavernae]|uniref:TRAM domain-containing protein n=1 Tax=Hymenobacter cavernae TaxID=2044852 RepID=A0ABQ1TLX6_9BACT|nr:hypothetical protein GCM10011383_07030 [Hymenobacter cavernae]